MGDCVTTDVCVIGGGPAGASTACRLRTLGYDVVVLDRNPSRRSQPGATLPSSILPLLETIGMRERIEAAGFLHAERIVTWWSTPYAVVRTLPGPTTLHVDRVEFDQLLLQNAESCGARVLRNAHAARIERLQGLWRIEALHSNERKVIWAHFVVDATGSRAILPGGRIRNSAPLIALYACWHSGKGTSSEGHVEAGQEEWFWCSPIGQGRSVVAVFLDPRRLAVNGPASVDGVYCALLKKFRLFSRTGCTSIINSVSACDASSRYSKDAVGKDFIRVGDACVSLDPLSSQGVQSAIASGIQASIVVNSLIKRPDDLDAAIAFYRNSQTARANAHRKRTARFYGERAAVCGTEFWRERGRSAAELQTFHEPTTGLQRGSRVRLSKVARMESVPTVQGDLVRLAPALVHEGLERPVAFVHGTEIVPLLRGMTEANTAESFVSSWCDRRVPESLGWQIMQWLWECKVVVPACKTGYEPSRSLAK